MATRKLQAQLLFPQAPKPSLSQLSVRRLDPAKRPSRSASRSVPKTKKGTRLTKPPRSAYNPPVKGGAGRGMLDNRRAKLSKVTDQMDISRMLQVFREEVADTGQTIPMVMGWAAVTLKLVGERLYIGLQVAKATHILEAFAVHRGAHKCELKDVDASATGIAGDPTKLGRWLVCDIKQIGSSGCRLSVTARKLTRASHLAK